MNERTECLDAVMDSEHTCRGPVTPKPSHAGTGTLITRCAAGHEEADRKAQEIQERYPDTDVPPAWFDESYAGERWNDDY